MATIKNLSRRLLKIIYEYYVDQNSKDFLSIDDILCRADDFRQPNRIIASLDYLVVKGFIIPSKEEEPRYKIMPAGLEFYESELTKQDASNKSVTINSNVVGQVNNLAHEPQANEQTNTHFAGKEFMKHYDVMTGFIKNYREFLKELKSQKAISPEKEEELLGEVDNVEAMIRSHDLDGES